MSDYGDERDYERVVEPERRTTKGRRRTNDPRTVVTYSVRQSVQVAVADAADGCGDADAISRSAVVDAIVGAFFADLAADRAIYYTGEMALVARQMLARVYPPDSPKLEDREL